MAKSITVRVRASDVLARLAMAAEKLGNLSIPVSQSAEYMLKETKLNFAKESTPDGAGWAALAASTLAQKSGGKILVESGALLGSIAIQGAGSKQAFITSTGVAYAIYHAAGTSKMPARKFIGISGRHETRINQIFKRYVKSLSL